MKVVLDSNVLVAAFGFGGICRAIVDVCIDSHELVLSETILAEVLSEFGGHPILSPREFWQRLK